MPIVAKAESENTFTPVPEGVHTAICYGIIDLGMQYSEKFDKTSHKVMIMWELPDELYKNDEGEEIPRVLSKEYTLSLSEKSTLRKDLQAWRGKAFTEQELEGFDLINILGKGCQIQIIHRENNGKTYANIASIMGLPKGMKLGEPTHEKIYFDLENPESLSKLAELPEWIQEKIKASETYKALTMVIPDSGDDAMLLEEDELPF